LNDNRAGEFWLLEAEQMADSEGEILNIAAGWLDAGHRVVLGTVIRATGSVPRAAGSHIAICDNGAFAGSVSAGCAENAVIDQALLVLQDEKSRRMVFGSGSDGFAPGLACGGEIEILLEPVI
jgi:xanthine dehydrogenase accessory factor